LVERVIDSAIDETGAADDRQDLVVLDQFGGKRGNLLRIRLLLGDNVLDWAAVDAAVVVYTIEVRLGHASDTGEVGARLLGDDGAEFDRRASRFLAIGEPTLHTRLGGGARAATRRDQQHDRQAADECS